MGRFRVTGKRQARCEGEEVMREAPLPVKATPGQRWRFRRDLVIYLAHRRNGLSQRMLADVFDLPRSRIAEIVKSFARYDTERME